MSLKFRKHLPICNGNTPWTWSTGLHCRGCVAEVCVYVSGKGYDHFIQCSGWYSLRALSAYIARAQYRWVLTVGKIGIKCTWRVPAAGGSLGEVGFSGTNLAHGLMPRDASNGVCVGEVGSTKSNLAQSDSPNT